MDRLKGVAKGGWHPGGDVSIHRDSWKSDLKNVATGKKTDPYADARNHTSAPLTSLKDPDSFGPPPRHKDKDSYPAPAPRSAASSSASTASPESRRPTVPQTSGGWGSAVPTPGRRREQEEPEPEEVKPPEPYRANTTGLRTDNLPKPPTRRVDGSESPSGATAPPPPPRTGQSAMPSLPPRRQAAPMPSLPPRMNDHPDEHTPPPPPPYQAVANAVSNPAAINVGAAARLGQAGIAVPGFGIGGGSNSSSQQNPSTATGHPSQLSELQQRFARLNSVSSEPLPAPITPTSLTTNSSVAAAAAQKKPPPPPPPKKAGLTDHTHQGSTDAPPPLPLGSKPRPS